MGDLDSDWQRKGATLSDKTAREEFGLTQTRSFVQSVLASSTIGKDRCTGTPGYGFSDERWKRWSGRTTVTAI